MIGTLILITLFVIYTTVLCDDGYLFYSQFRGSPYTVTYDKRSFLINGKRSMFVSGSIHYPRFSVGEWDIILKKAKRDGLNLIQLYTFWNYHQPLEDNWIFNDNANLTEFIRLCGENDLFVNIRLGPYVCSEWTYGGLPVWVMEKPGMKVRSYNTVFMEESTKYINKIIDEVRHLFADKGGPIILGQIENELSTNDDKYVEWCGELTDSLKVNVPFMMCNGRTASNLINACNGDDCADWIKSHGQNKKVLISQPATWTENEGWFQIWGEYDPCFTDVGGCKFPSRLPEDISYATLRFYARGGSHMDYYMYFGGNHFGRTGSASMTTWYAEYVNFHADLIENEPKRTHLYNLHTLIKNYGSVIVEDEAQLDHAIVLPWWDGSSWKVGTQQTAFVYQGNKGYIAFIENDAPVEVKTKFNDKEFVLAKKSMIAVDKDLNIIYDTGAVERVKQRRTRKVLVTEFAKFMADEPLLEVEERPIITSNSLQDSLHITQGLTDYLYYETEVQLPQNSYLSITCQKSAGYVVYVDKTHIYNFYDTDHYEGTFTHSNIQIPFTGLHNLTILVEMFGISDAIAPGHGVVRGGLTQVSLNNADISKNKWIHKPYLYGEIHNYTSIDGSSKIKWDPYVYSADVHTKWYKLTFDMPDTAYEESIIYDVEGLGRGHAYLNGRDLGRYWSIKYQQTDIYTQRYYHIPKDWFKQTNNILILGEITGPVDLSKFKIMVSKLE